MALAILDTENLYDSFALKFSIASNSVVRFKASFLGAFNDCLMDLYNAGTIDEPSLLTSVDDDTDLTINYLPLVKDGIRYYLQKEGEWVKGDMVDTYAFIQWQKRIGEAANLQTDSDVTGETYTGPWSETA